MSLSNPIDLFRPDGTRRRHANLPPSARISPLRQLWRYAADQAAFFEELARLPGGAFTIDVPGDYGPVVAFSDDETCRLVASGSSEDFGQANDIASFFVGPNSILLLDGDLHSQARGRTLSAFSGERMRGYGPSILESADRFIDRLAPGRTLSAMEAGRDMALDVILRALFGYSSGPEYDRMFGRIAGFMEQSHNPFGTVASMVLPPSIVRTMVTGKRDPSTMRLLPDQGFASLGMSIPGIREGREMLDGLVEIIERRKAHLDDGGSDALGYILRKARDSGRAYSAEQSVDELLTLLLAGHDTTAITLSWLLYRLGRAPKVVARLREELDEAFPDAPIDTRNIERLPYLRAVLDETLRLDGLGRGVGRRLLRPMRLGGYDLPAGTFVLAYTYGRNRDARFWDLPDDFAPEQFVGKKLKPHEFTPFGAGYRRCIGAAFAEYELRILAGEFVRRVDFSFPADREVEVGMLGPVIAPVGPVPIDIRAVRPAIAPHRPAVTS